MEMNWFPYAKTELEKMGHEVIARTFPDNFKARRNIWIPFLRDELKPNENSILIGHSSGAVATMRYTEENRIKGSVLVGAHCTHLDDENEKQSGYFDGPWNWDAIKANQDFILQFASTDDPYIPVENSRHIHTNLSTIYFEFSDKGHFGGGDRTMETFPELIEELKKFI
eukprot:CAMPEP_0171464688 /NCGR_PEP_ID=MMETSP0945-20130129/7937_1 /TAXON_ID=109269 /ORGANISM="Vaucheria litorea, Strain CCMP2940" /LENGTH=168 /DNA_ID=CAMNT_0011991887 /DNA_START=22 /DNA_END=525 /DNA_ORIENTATION=+